MFLLLKQYGFLHMWKCIQKRSIYCNEKTISSNDFLNFKFILLLRYFCATVSK